MVRQEFAEAVEPAAEEGLQAAIKAAEKAGASVKTIDLPESVQEAWRIHPIIQDFEAHRALAWEFSEHHDEIAPMLRASLDDTVGLTPKQYDDARRIARRGRRELGELFEGFDVLLTYSAPGTAPAKELASTGSPRYNRLWTLNGQSLRQRAGAEGRRPADRRAGDRALRQRSGRACSGVVPGGCAGEIRLAQAQRRAARVRPRRLSRLVRANARRPRGHSGAAYE
ncbi:hypothetical protein ACVWXN_002532 [Bradyrhizobium sp. i1.4.4]